MIDEKLKRGIEDRKRGETTLKTKEKVRGERETRERERRNNIGRKRGDREKADAR